MDAKTLCPARNNAQPASEKYFVNVHRLITVSVISMIAASIQKTNYGRFVGKS
jgi:hypothetical protein